MEREERKLLSSLEKPLPTDVPFIEVEELHYKMELFASRAEASIIRMSFTQGRISLNTVLTGISMRTNHCQVAWDIMGGLKHWLECCASEPLTFLCQHSALAQSRWAPTTQEDQQITGAEYKQLQQWIRGALGTCMAFKMHFPHHLVRHVKPTTSNFKDGTFQTAVLKGQCARRNRVPLNFCRFGLIQMLQDLW